MNFNELHHSLTQEHGLVANPLDSGKGWSYFFDHVEGGSNTTRLLRVHNDGERILEAKLSMSSLKMRRNVFLQVPLSRQSLAQAVKEELAIYYLRYGQAAA